ncbi:hypothetical protein [Thermococcus barophilus]|nr:hypothetical protein [Thermococcus barophilus]
MRRIAIWFVGLFVWAYFLKGIEMALQSIEPPYTIGDYIGYIFIITLELIILAWFTYPIWGLILYTWKAHKRLQRHGITSIPKALKIGAKLTFSGPHIPNYKQKITKSMITGFIASRLLFSDDILDEMIEMGYFEEKI